MHTSTYRHVTSLLAILLCGTALLSAQETLVATRADRFSFESRLASCSGPASFRALDDWCDEYGREEWRERLQPFLRSFTPAGESARVRARARLERARVVAAVGATKERLVSDLVGGLDELIDWMEREGCTQPAELILLEKIIERAIDRAGREDLARDLHLRLSTLRSGEHDARAAKGLARTFRKKLERIIKRVVGRSLSATKQALGAREPGLAFDLFQYVLQLDPDNTRAHRSLGHKRARGQWLRPYQAAQLRKGLVWDPDRAWILVKGDRCYQEGMIFDPGAQEWLPLEDANHRHANPHDPWVIHTEHFELRSTADLARTAWIAARLEAFYLAMFRQYDLFFAGKDAARRIFGVAAGDEPLRVNFYRNRAQYLGHGQAPGGSAGYYSSAKGASFFYDQGEDVTTLQHELTHQILAETTSGQAPAWLSEGAAVYLECLRFEGDTPIRGCLGQNPRLCTYRRLLEEGDGEHRFRQVVAMTSQADWNRKLTGANYRGAGAVVNFLCHMDDGRYRADFLEMLRDAYRGKQVEVEDYVNLSDDALDALMSHYYRAGGSEK